jgi:hypothetical protein
MDQIVACAAVLGWCGKEIKRALQLEPPNGFIWETFGVFLEMAGTSLTEFRTEPPRGLPLPL